MKKQPQEHTALPAAPEQIRLHRPVGRAGLTVFAFLICISILIAAFAVSQVWKRGKTPDEKEGPAGSIPKVTEESTGKSTEEPTLPNGDDLPEAPEPSNATPIVSRTYPDSGVRNETTFALPEGTLPIGLFREALTAGEEPLVLILHTHPQQAYQIDESEQIPAPLGSTTYSTDPTRTVAAAGKILCETLCKAGIPAVHAAEESPYASNLGAYANAAEVIAAWLERYPSIRLVIDVQRDAILDSDGNYIRPVTETDSGKAAQTIAIVGSNAEGSDYPGWQKNYMLALALREEMNWEGNVFMRAVLLRRSSYNQELSSHALLLVIGSGANTVGEAECAAVQIGEALAECLR